MTNTAGSRTIPEFKHGKRDTSRKYSSTSIKPYNLVYIRQGIGGKYKFWFGTHTFVKRHGMYTLFAEEAYYCKCEMFLYICVYIHKYYMRWQTKIQHQITLMLLKFYHISLSIYDQSSVWYSDLLGYERTIFISIPLTIYIS